MLHRMLPCSPCLRHSSWLLVVKVIFLVAKGVSGGENDFAIPSVPFRGRKENNSCFIMSHFIETDSDGQVEWVEQVVAKQAGMEQKSGLGTHLILLSEAIVALRLTRWSKVYTSIAWASRQRRYGYRCWHFTGLPFRHYVGHGWLRTADERSWHIFSSNGGWSLVTVNMRIVQQEGNTRITECFRDISAGVSTSPSKVFSISLADGNLFKAQIRNFLIKSSWKSFSLRHSTRCVFISIAGSAASDFTTKHKASYIINGPIPKYLQHFPLKPSRQSFRLKSAAMGSAGWFVDFSTSEPPPNRCNGFPPLKMFSIYTFWCSNTPSNGLRQRIDSINVVCLCLFFICPVAI